MSQDISPYKHWTIPTLSLAGLLVSAYLTYLHLSQTQALCPVGNCDLVNASPYAEVRGIPVALFGLVAYAVLLLLALLKPQWENPTAAWFNLAIFTISLAGTLYSAYLTYIELFILRAICIWCVTSAVIITIILALAVEEVTKVGSD